MKPEIIRLDDTRRRRRLSGLEIVEHDGRPYAVVRNAEHDGEFHLMHAPSWVYRGTTVHSVESGDPFGAIYTPPHPSTKAEDVMGATYAYDDGTYWHYAHCSPDEQIDFAADARTFAIDQFTVAIANAHLKIDEATNAVAEAAAFTKAQSIVKFAEAIGADVHKRVVGATLGHYHRNQHHDHRRELAIEGIDAVLEAWRVAGLTDKAVRADRSNVSATATEIRTSLTTTHDIEWRAAREKRLNDAKAAKGDDPVGGYEYCYANVGVPAVIAGDANLPDPAWNFDQLRTGAIVRGSYVYSDAEPTLSRFLPWIIRFKRPIPEGTVAGADIGSVAWSQETAYTKSA